MVGTDALQCALSRARGVCEKRRARSGRPAARISGDVTRRIESASYRDAVPQSRLHGCRGIDSRQSDGWRDPAGRLRQDHAGAADGRGVMQSAGARRVGRADAERQVPWQEYRLGHGRVADVGGSTRRHDDAGRIHRSRIVHEPLARALHDDGHGVDDGVDGRIARHGFAAQRGDSGRRCAQAGARAHGRQADRRHGSRRPHDGQDPHAPGFRERDPHECGDRRLDQRGGASDRVGETHRRGAFARRLGAGFGCAVSRELATVGRIPDGGFLLRGWPAGGAQATRRARPATSRSTDGERQDDLGQRVQCAESR